MIILVVIPPNTSRTDGAGRKRGNKSISERYVGGVTEPSSLIEKRQCMVKSKGTHEMCLSPSVECRYSHRW